MNPVPPLPPPSPPRGPLLAGALTLVLAVAALYARTGGFAFVSFDDGSYVTENPAVAGGLTPAGLRWAWSAFHSANWHPLTWMSHQLDVTLFGLEPGPPHLVNAGLHAFNAVLLLLFLARATGRLGASFLVALLFAVHPLRAESVAWISERKDVLASLFFFLALLAYARHARAPSAGRLAWVALCLALGLLAKPMLVTLPLVLLLLDVWPLRRPEARPRTLLLEKLPLLALAGASALVTVAAQRAGEAVQSLGHLSVSERLATALQASLAYLRETLWPTKLAFFHPHPALLPGGDFAPFGATTLLAALVLVGVSVSTWRLRARLPMAVVGWGWYLVMLLPVAGLVQVGSQLHADRYTYLPMLGPLLGLVFALDRVLGTRARRAGFGLGLALAAACVPVAWAQIGTWRDTRALAERALAVTEDNYVAHEHLGLEDQKAGELERASAHYRAALAIQPDLPSSHSNLATILEFQGRREEALAEFDAALRLDPSFLKARLSLGLFHERAGELEAAAEQYGLAARQHPESLDAWVRLGEVTTGLGRLPEARAALLAALERVGPLPAERAELEASLGRVLDEEGDARGALARFAAAEALVPDHAVARHGRAWILATRDDPSLRDPARALALLERCAASGERPSWTHARVLAAALAASGRFAEAARAAAEASALAPRTEWERLAAERERYLSNQDLRR